MKIKQLPRIGIFLRFYLFWMLTALIIYYSVLVIKHQMTEALTQMIQYQMIQKTVNNIELHISSQPQRDWHEDIKQLNNFFTYPLTIEKISALQRRLNPEDYQMLLKADGRIIIHNGFIYKSIKGTDEVLLIGPIIATLLDSSDGLSRYELQLILYEWGGTLILSFIFSYIWLRPVWKSVNTLRETAQSLSSGDFTARAPEKISYLVQPIAQALNSMAEKVQQFITLRREMTNAMAHEIRTPIARIHFHLLNYIENNTGKNDISDLNKVYQELEEIEALVTMALNYARFDSDNIRIHPSKQYASSWLKTQANFTQLNERRINIIPHYSDDLGWIEIDSKMMQYVTRNLISNAKKHAKGIIYLNAERVNEHLFIVVEDDGEGIHPDEYEKIFLPFYRGKGDEEAGISGFGLGLAIAKRIIALHGGSISVAQSDLGGAKFTIAFPCQYRPIITI